MSTETAQSSDATGSTVPLRRFRLAGFYLAVLVTLAIGVIVTGELFALLVLGWIEAGAIAELGAHRLHVMGIGLFVFTGLLLVASQLYRPLRHGGALVGAVAIFGAATLAMAFSGSESVMMGVFFLVPTALAALLHPAGRKLFAREQVSPVLVALAVVAVVPLALYVAGQFGLQIGQPLADEHAAHEHYLMIGLLGLAMIVAASVAAAGVAGWRVVAWIAGLSVAYFGLLTAFMPGQTGSAGVLWGGLAILWALAFVAVAEYSRRESAGPLFRRPLAAGRP